MHILSSCESTAEGLLSFFLAKVGLLNDLLIYLLSSPSKILDDVFRLFVLMLPPVFGYWRLKNMEYKILFL